MTDKEILLDLVDFFADNLHRTIGDLSTEVLTWQPDPGANNIAVTVWHIGRLLDYLSARLLENRPEAELWLTRGWCAQTGYDPRDIGWAGSGALIGYTQAEVEEVPILPADDLLAYFDQAHEAVSATVRDFPAGALHQLAPGCPEEAWTAYEWIRICLMNAFEHLGEIKAFVAMRERQARAT